MNFNQGNMTEVRGHQKGKWDHLVTYFKEPGDYISYGKKSDELPDGLTSPIASQIAKRMEVLTGFKFHSFWSEVKKEYFVRRRLEGEVPDKEEEGTSDNPLATQTSDWD